MSLSAASRYTATVGITEEITVRFPEPDPRRQGCRVVRLRGCHHHRCDAHEPTPPDEGARRGWETPVRTLSDKGCAMYVRVAAMRRHGVSQQYHAGQRSFQDRFDSRRLADRLAESTSDVIGEPFKTFVEDRDMFFIATANEDGWPEASYKGGEPGFVRVIDDHTLVFPVYNGNGMFLTTGNLAVNPRVGLLFIDFETGTRLRISGHASMDPDDPLTGTYPGAQFVVRVRAREVFANCRRYVHRYTLVERSRFVPSAGTEPPVPDWKLDEWFAGTLPHDDPALDPDHPSAPAVPQF